MPLADVDVAQLMHTATYFDYMPWMIMQVVVCLHLIDTYKQRYMREDISWCHLQLDDVALLIYAGHDRCRLVNACIPQLMHAVLR